MTDELPKIKCLSIKQPFANWILEGIKLRELRTYPIKHRGVLAIHSSMKPDYDFMKQYGIAPDKFKNGFILGLARITGQIQHAPGDYSWLIEPVCVFENPIQYKGSLGLWDLNFEAVQDQIPERLRNYFSRFYNKIEIENEPSE